MCRTKGCGDCGIPMLKSKVKSALHGIVIKMMGLILGYLKALFNTDWKSLQSKTCSTKLTSREVLFRVYILRVHLEVMQVKSY